MLTTIDPNLPDEVESLRLLVSVKKLIPALIISFAEGGLLKLEEARSLVLSMPNNKALCEETGITPCKWLGLPNIKTLDMAIPFIENQVFRIG